MNFSNVTRNSMTVKTDCQNEYVLIGKEQYRLPNEFDASQVIDFNNDFSQAPTIDGCKVLYKGTENSINISGLTRYKLYYFRVIDLTTNEEVTKSRWTLR